MAAEWRQITRKAAIIIALVALVFAAGYYIVLRQWDLYTQISLAVGIIGLAAYVALNPDEIRSALTGRQARFGSNALILGLAFLGILVVVNYLAYKNTQRWDLTADKSNTLAEETLEVLDSLQEPVLARAFFSADASLMGMKDDARILLDQYVYESNDHFNYEFIDPNKDFAAAQEAEITRDGSLVLYMGDLKQSVTSITEDQITEALVKLKNPGVNGIYFLTGHGEYPLEPGSDQSYSALATELKAKNYKVETLNLRASPDIPQDTNVIVVAGPKKPLSEEEVSLLGAYLDNGGSVIVMEDPTLSTEFGDSPDPLAQYIQRTYGVNINDDIVIDVFGYQTRQNPYYAFGYQYADHAITQQMNNLGTEFLIARSVSVDDTVGPDYTKTSLILTVNESWGEMDMDSVQANNIAFDQEVDFAGPVSLAAAVEGSTNQARLVVFGDSDFASDAAFGNYGNGDMIINSIDWAAREEDLISLTSRGSVTRTLIQPQPYTLGLILLGSLVILPGIVLAAGIGSWISRRRQG